MIKILDERKHKILMEIVESFIKTDEPVGSKTLSEKSSIGVSPATIRNDMRVLEEEGFILKPHTSAGRIPSDKGYRMYVNLYSEEDLVPRGDFQDVLVDNIQTSKKSLSDILGLSSDLFAKLTNYTTVIIAPRTSFKTIKHLSLSQYEDGKIIAVYIDIDDTTETRVIYYDNFSNDESIREYNKFIASKLLYKTVEDLKVFYQGLEGDFPHLELSKIILKLGIEFLNQDRTYNVYPAGMANLLRFGLEDNYSSVKSILELLEDESKLVDLMTRSGYEDELSISIGRENEEEVLKSASVIMARYDIFDDDYGTIGIIGPTRMDYKYLIETVLGLSNTLSSLNEMMKR